MVIVNALNYSSSKYVQYVFDYNFLKMFFRLYDTSGTSVYKDWQEVTANLPTFYKNYATLAALMDDLNVNPVGNKVNVTNQNIDLNNLDDGFYIGNNFKDSVGAPAIAGLLTQWGWTIGANKYAFQLFFSYDAKMYWRTFWSASWTPWRKIEGTVVTTT